MSEEVPRVRLPIALAASAAAVTLETAACWWLLRDRATDVVMVYLLGVVVVAMRFGYAASLATAALGVAAFDFFFAAPYLSFAVDDKRYLLTFSIMLFVGYVVSNLTERVRRQAVRTSAFAVERARLAEEAQRISAQVHNERLRSALLSSVSHDLLTPLAVVQGTATALLEGADSLPRARRRECLQTLSDEAGHLHRVVRNILDMTSLQAGSLRVKKDWHPLEEIVGVALNRLDEVLGLRKVDVSIAPDASLVAADEILLQHVFVNLVENAARYTPPKTGIRIAAERAPDGVRIEVADCGPGVPRGQEEAIFEKFHRAVTMGGGMGLGLTICRGIVEAHGGRIWCENRTPESGGGASFRFVLPFEGESPPMNALPEAPDDRDA